MTTQGKGGVREEFEKAALEEANRCARLGIPMAPALWAARWMAERCMDATTNSCDCYDKIRQLSQELL